MLTTTAAARAEAKAINLGLLVTEAFLLVFRLGVTTDFDKVKTMDVARQFKIRSARCDWRRTCLMGSLMLALTIWDAMRAA